MASRRRQEEILRFHGFLLQVYEEGKQNNTTGPSTFETDLRVHLIDEGHTNPLEKLWDQNGKFFIVEKMRSYEESSSLEEWQNGESSVSEAFPKENLSASPLALSRARQLISFYTMSQNPNMKHLQINHAVQLPPLWVRCEPSDPKQTIWLGAEPLRSGSNLSGIRLHTVNCNGPVSNNNYSIGLEELKENHRMRHHASDLTITGFARYEFLESTSLDSLTQEDSLIPLERNIYADFAWEGVKMMLQTPPLSSAALLTLQMASGSPLSSVYEPSRELQFLLSLAETLKNGVIKWPKTLGRKSAVELVQKLLKDLKDEVDGLKSPNEDDTEDNTAAVIGSLKTLFSQRGDLDFLELLWCNIWRNVASHEELMKCFSLVIRALQRGELQTWIHQESNSLLSKLIKQSYHGKMETVSLDGESPVQMLLEIGMDKMRRDYISYFVGKEFAIRTHLDYFMSTSVDLQEQVHRIQKLHHMLEIVDNCLDLIKLEHENLIFLTQSCISYYKENPLNEKHAFQLPVRTSLVKEFYQNSHPQIWRVEISSGQGPKRVKTIWQLSSTPPAEHIQPPNGDSLDDTEICGNKEKHFITLWSSLFFFSPRCSQLQHYCSEALAFFAFTIPDGVVTQKVLCTEQEVLGLDPKWTRLLVEKKGAGQQRQLYEEQVKERKEQMADIPSSAKQAKKLLRRTGMKEGGEHYQEKSVDSSIWHPSLYPVGASEASVHICKQNQASDMLGPRPGSPFFVRSRRRKPNPRLIPNSDVGSHTGSALVNFHCGRRERRTHVSLEGGRAGRKSLLPVFSAFSPRQSPKQICNFCLCQYREKLCKDCPKAPAH